VKADAGSRVTIVNQNSAYTLESVLEELEQAEKALTIPAAPTDDLS
jgi:hypothetical protein